MRLLIAWDADRPEATLRLLQGDEILADVRATLAALVRLGLLLAERGALPPPDLRAWTEALLTEPGVCALGACLRLGQQVLLEVCTSEPGGETRRCTAVVVRWDGVSWHQRYRVPDRPLLQWSARVGTRWQNLPVPQRFGAQLVLLLGAALLSLTPWAFRTLELPGQRLMLQVTPGSFPRSPVPRIGILLVPPADAAVASNDRAVAAEALEACLSQHAPWVALDVPVNKVGTHADALWRAAEAHRAEVLLGVTLAPGQRGLIPPALTLPGEPLSSLSFSWSGFRGGARAAVEPNLQVTVGPEVPGLPEGQCLPTLPWSMASRIPGSGAWAYAAPSATTYAWMPFAIPEQEVSTTNPDLIVRTYPEEDWTAACSQVDGTVLAFADWRTRPDDDRETYRGLGWTPHGARLLEGVALTSAGIEVPGPVVIALQTQAILAGPLFRTWDLVVAEWMGPTVTLRPCDQGDLVARGVGSRTVSVLLGQALWFALIIAGSRRAVARTQRPWQAWMRGAGFGVGVVGVCLFVAAFTRIFLPMVASLVLVAHAAGARAFHAWEEGQR